MIAPARAHRDRGIGRSGAVKVIEIEGVGEVQAAKLAEHGVTTTQELLSVGGSARGREVLAAATGISEKVLLGWVNRADLMRLDGVGSEFSDLLEAAGVDSTAELARRNAANLANTFQEVVAARPNLVRRIPSEETVAGWIAQAQGMDKVVSH
jgi:predicted flap endonuclease-1-like 5' DNA nuclease